MATKQATKKEVTVLNVYKFRQVARICFEVLSSDETTKYHTCFSNSAEHGGVCSCPATSPKGCYHINQLRPRAQAYFDSRQPAAPVLDAEELAAIIDDEDETPGLDAAEEYIASLKKQDEAKRLAEKWQTEEDPTLAAETYLQKLRRLEREQAERKRDAWKERAQFGGQAHKMEVAPSGRLVPMR